MSVDLLQPGRDKMKDPEPYVCLNRFSREEKAARPRNKHLCLHCGNPKAYHASMDGSHD